MKKIKLLLLLVISAFLFTACEDYVTDVDNLIDEVEDDRLNSEDQVEFQIIGVQHAFTIAVDNLTVAVDGLSDQFFYDDDVLNATYSSFEDIDLAVIFKDNTSTVYHAMHRARKYADVLIDRITNKITFSAGKEDIKKKGLYYGYFYAGLTRHYLATYYGRNKTEGGVPLDGSAFRPSSEIYAEAIANFDEALKYADATQTKLVNSLKARVYLYQGNYTAAATAAAAGMVEGDAAFKTLYSDESNNYYWEQAGAYRSQFVIDNRMVQYVADDAEEANRIAYKLADLVAGATGTFYRQNKYPEKNSSLAVMTWQENNLMLAELAIRGNHSGDADALVNAVRASHSITTNLSNVDLDGIYIERDKELFAQGQRLPDQRRFGKFHLPGKWEYLPIHMEEYDSNPNMKD